ncbi:MAG TPA: ABC transporter ATP-binding protein [Chloroflexota bacterium]|jgi:ABC-type multidrug transport system fused ATPase/permease subunit|nr:ABC transporter ATP-binding protein [Chloroflexota bacterium]
MPIPPTYRRSRPGSASGFLASYVASQWRRVLLLGVLLLATIALQLANPQIVRRFIDDATAGAPVGALASIALVFLGAALALQVAQVGEVYLAQNIGLTATNRLRADLTRHVLRLDPPFHAAHTPGELIERTDGDVGTLGNFFARFAVHLFGNALLLVGILALLTRIDWRVGAAVTAWAALGIGLMVWLRRLAVPRFAALRQANADLFGMIEERLASTEDVRANGGVAYVIHRLLERSRHLLWAGVGARLAGAGTFHAASLCLHLSTVTALAVAADLALQGELTIGTVYLVFAYAESLRRPLEGIARQLQDLQQAAASIGRVRTLLAERSAIVDGPGAALPPGALSLELDGVTFGYESGEPALRDVSLRLRPGQVLGLLGRTGGGKTTLARLLFRLYDPDQGVVRIGGVDLREPVVDALRARIGVVTQDIQLFHASVRDNVTLFDRDVPDARVEAVLEELGLGAWLRGRPAGLDTKLAAGGGSLSAGEAQLLAFARVFLKDPGLVVLDEASSRLDPATERLLERAVNRLLAGRTAIVIAHRLATVQRADRILILEDGRIAEEGERIALAADRQSRFSRLMRVGLDEVLV